MSETVLPGYPKEQTVIDPVATTEGARHFLRLRITQH